MKTFKEIKDEAEDTVLSGIKKDKRESFLKNLLELQKLGRVYGIEISEVVVSTHYKENSKPLTQKVLGVFLIDIRRK